MSFTRLIRTLALALPAIALAACASSAAYEKMLNGWVGKPVDALVQEWGPPQATHTYEDGRRALQYRERATDFQPPVTAPSPYTVRDEVIFPGSMRELVCITTFEADEHGTIRSWKWRGNACAISE